MILFIGCSEEEPTTWNDPIERTPFGQEEAVVTAGVAEQPERLEWKAPASWHQLPPTQFVEASWEIPLQEADTTAKGEEVVSKSTKIAISRLPVSLPYDTNFNRWATSQLGLPAFTPEEIEAKVAAAEKIDFLTDSGLTGEIFFFENTKTDKKMLIHWVKSEQNLWTVKILDTIANVNAHEEVTLEFTRSFRIMDEEVSTESAAGEVKTETVEKTEAETTTEESEEISYNWSAPAHWEEVDKGMNLVKFQIQGKNGEKFALATVNVMSLLGDGGGLKNNLREWARQLSLEFSEDSPLPEGEDFTIAGESGKLYELQNTTASRPLSIVVVILPEGNKTSFFKIKGDVALVSKERDNFLDFLRSFEKQ